MLVFQLLDTSKVYPFQAVGFKHHNLHPLQLGGEWTMPEDTVDIPDPLNGGAAWPESFRSQ